ncbi:MAG: TRAP transporter small permease [Chloroflexi bacterium]|nr:TRAP transporter small permease [Chloroflexota bacterium]
MRRFESFVSWYNDRLIRWITDVLAGTASIALVAVTLMISSYIIIREMTPLKIYFVEEWTEMLTVLIGYFAFAYALRMKRHIIVDMLVRHFPEATRRVLELSTGILGLIAIAFTLQRAISFLQYNWVRHIVYQGVIRTPMWIPSLFIVIGLTVFVLAILGYNMQKIIEFTAFARKKKAAPLAAQEG